MQILEPTLKGDQSEVLSDNVLKIDFRLGCSLNSLYFLFTSYLVVNLSF